MKVDPRLGAAFLIVFSFAAGWATREHFAPPPPAHAPAAPSASAPPSASASAFVPVVDPAAMETAFDDIYRHASWGTNGGDAGTSGFGSTLKATALYRAFLVQFMKDADVHSVVDAGCGDWEFSQAIDWTGIDYKGFDIVKDVVASDTKRFGKPNVQFFAANIVDADLPKADLLITKHVLQHLPTAAVLKFLQQLPKYKHVLIESSVSSRTLSGKNEDIAPGGFREIDLTRPPFNVRGAKVLTYWDGGNMQQVVYVARPDR